MSESAVVGDTRSFPTQDGIIHYEVIEASAPNPSAQSSIASSPIVPPTLTLLHNFMSTGRAAWSSMLAKLAEHHRVILPDLPGHGRSIGQPAGFHYGQMAKQLASLMVHEKAASGHLAGCSAGGMIAQIMVDQQLVTPQTLTLISTTYSINEDVTGMSHALKPENFRAGNRWMAATAKLHDPYRYPGYYEAVMLPAFRRLDPALAIDLPLNALHKWQMPVCLIHGAEDEFFPVAIVNAMADAIPNSTAHIVADQPHALIFRQPWRVQALLSTFLQDHRGSYDHTASY